MLAPGLDDVRIVSPEHMSNGLPPQAHELINETDGWVLNLSAGGTMNRIEKVVEMEYAIFRHTDVVGDVHTLPFADESFAAVIALNAFEHYRNPSLAAQEIYRILKPGGKVLIHTAFLQPLHEPPWHFFNCTRYGLEEWFTGFKKQHLSVSLNFNPAYSISWLSSDIEAALRHNISAEAADRFLNMPLGKLASFWRDRQTQDPDVRAVIEDLAALPQAAQEQFSAGFEYLGAKPK